MSQQWSSRRFYLEKILLLVSLTHFCYYFWAIIRMNVGSSTLQTSGFSITSRKKQPCFWLLLFDLIWQITLAPLCPPGTYLRIRMFLLKYFLWPGIFSWKQGQQTSLWKEKKPEHFTRVVFVVINYESSLGLCVFVGLLSQINFLQIK